MDKLKKQKLFTEFPQTSTSDWENLIQQNLKGADYNKRLVWNTIEGFSVKPYYRSDDIKDDANLISKKTTDNSWLTRQNIVVKDFEKSNEHITNILNKGVDSICFIFDSNNNISVSDFKKLFKNIYFEKTEINFSKCTKESFKNFIEYLKNENINLNTIKGSIEIDILCDFALTGTLKNDELDNWIDLFELSRQMPEFRVLSIFGKTFHNSGANASQELAISIAIAAEYISFFIDKGLDPKDIIPKFTLTLAVGTNYFFEIAKIRAARLIWGNLCNAYNLPEELSNIFIHCETSNWDKTLYDPYVNVLRTSTEAMAAVIGGTDSLRINAYNHVSGTGNKKLPWRIARNQQNVLKHETNLEKIIDPSAGSYYIENLTDQLAEKAWSIFQKIEQKGGYIEALKLGYIQNIINETANNRNQALISRKDALIGINQFPNITEKIDISIDEETFNKSDKTNSDAIIETIKPYRGAQVFEKLRYKTDQHSLNNQRPTVFLLTYGNVTMRMARAQFSSNFFGIAGFKVIDNNGFNNINEGLSEAEKAKADIIVFCSSDDEYSDIIKNAEDIIKMNKSTVIAGYPKNLIDDLKANNFKHFIHLKSNVIETLELFAKEVMN